MKRPFIIFLFCLFLSVSASAAFGQNRFDKADICGSPRQID